MRCRIPATLLALALIVALAAPAAAGWFDRGEKGDGEMTTRSYDLDDCHAILLECGLDIDVRFGGEQIVELTMDENLLELYEIEERGGVLVVAASKNPRPSREAHLELVLRKLGSVEIRGAGDITIEDLDGDELAIEIQGAGDIEIDGEVEHLELEIDGAGDIDARELKARHAVVEVNGAGDVKVHATESCDVTINGVGDVDVWGQPETFHKTVHGIGDVDRK